MPGKNITYDDSRVDHLAEVFQALGDPTRVRIMLSLAAEEFTVTELANQLGLTPPAISHQMRLLRFHRLVSSRRDGREVRYSIADAHVLHWLQEGIQHLDDLK